MPTNESKTPRPCPKCHEGVTFTLRTQTMPWTYSCGVCGTFIGQLELSTLTKENKKLKEELVRYHDLVRYQRSELHQANLITDEEYAALVSDNKSVARLESYDQLKTQLLELQADKEMLDWLEKNEVSINTLGDRYKPGFYWHIYYTPKGSYLAVHFGEFGDGLNLRLAITAAMRK